MNSSKQKEPIQRKLEIDAQFNSHAATLVAAAQAGLFVHHTSNISESGSPLEKGVLNLFSRSLPKTFEVFPGYFFDEELNLSNQCDLLICDHSEVLYLPPTDGLDQKYVPFQCVRVIGQIKNNFDKLESALDQCATSMAHWEKMVDKDTYADKSNAPVEPLAIIIIGKGGNESEARKLLGAPRSHSPAYVLMVEAGLFYVPYDSIREVIKNNPSFAPDYFRAAQGNNLPFVLVKLDDKSQSSGRLLMRLFFAIIQYVANTSVFYDLIDKVEKSFPLKYDVSPKIDLNRQISAKPAIAKKGSAKPATSAKGKGKAATVAKGSAKPATAAKGKGKAATVAKGSAKS